eukprot:g7685.t1 g7685   contig26:49785-50238(+)
MITQRRNRYNSQSADDGAGSVIVDDLYKYHALVDDDDGGCDEESKINDIGIEHSDVDDDDDEEEDVDRFRHCPEKLKRALKVAEALRYPFIFVVILWAAISTISFALDVNDNESDFSIQFV